MIYLKSFLVGVGAAVAALVLWIVCALLLPIYIPLVAQQIRGAGGTAVSYITSDSVLVAALIGFVVGAVWEMRRLRLI